MNNEMQTWGYFWESYSSAVLKMLCWSITSIRLFVILTTLLILEIWKIIATHILSSTQWWPVQPLQPSWLCARTRGGWSHANDIFCNIDNAGRMKRTEGEGRGSDNIRLTLSLSGKERRAYRVPRCFGVWFTQGLTHCHQRNLGVKSHILHHVLHRDSPVTCSDISSNLWARWF